MRLALAQRRYDDAAREGEAAVARFAELLQGDRPADPSAIAALGTIRSPAAVDPLLELLRRAREEKLRLAAVAALSGLARTLPDTVVASLGHRDATVRSTVADVLQRVGWHPSNARERALLAVAEDRITNAIAEGREAVGPLMTLARESAVGARKALRIEAVSALGDLGDPRAVPLLEYLMREKDDVLFVRVAVALGTIGGELAGEALLRVLASASKARLDAGEPALLVVAASAPGPLVRALVAPSREERCLAAATLEKVGWEPQDIEQRVHFSLVRGVRLTGLLGPEAVEPLERLASAREMPLLLRTIAARALGELEPVRLESMALPLLGEAALMLSRTSMDGETKEGMQALAYRAGVPWSLVETASKALGFERRNIDPNRRHEHLVPSLGEGTAAVMKLCEDSSGFASHVLELVSRKEDIVVTLPACMYSERFELDFGEQRRLAKAALSSRRR